MNRIPDLREKILLPNEIKQAAQDSKLVLFIGAGISRLVGLPSWGELAEKTLKGLCEKGYLNYAETDQLKHLDPKQIFSIAELVDKKGFKKEIATHLKKPESEGIYKIINKIGCVCVTTNYDELLTPSHSSTTDGSEPLGESSRVENPEEISIHHLNEPGTIIHLHGYKDKPDTMVVTTEDYLNHYNLENIQKFLEFLFREKIVVFLGYGLKEMEILEYILRQRNTKNVDKSKYLSTPMHFNVQGFFSNQKSLYEHLYRYYEKTFKVKTLGFIRDYEDHKAIEYVIKNWANQIDIPPASLHRDIEFMKEVLSNA